MESLTGMTSRPKLVLAGGSGFIGKALVNHFSDWDVVLLTRGNFLSQTRSVQWDGRSQGAWAKEVDGADAVINLAGAPITLKWTPENRKKIVDSRVESTTAIGQAISEASNPPPVWVNSSAVGFYGNRGDEVLDEGSSAGSGFLAEACQAWEEAMLAISLPKTRCSLMRTGIVLGRGGGALDPLSKLAKVGLGGSAGDGAQWIPWIHIEDLCRMCRWMLEAGTGPVNGCAPEPARNRDFMAALRHAVKRPWSPPVPRPVLQIVGKLFGPDPETILGSTRVVPRFALENGFDWSYRSLDLALADLVG
jgi:uncharacterized protein (TIGR01777 family)